MISLAVVVLMVAMILFGLFMVFRLNKRDPVKKHLDSTKQVPQHSHRH